jgi:hypothetical protein
VKNRGKRVTPLTAVMKAFEAAGAGSNVVKSSKKRKGGKSTEAGALAGTTATGTGTTGTDEWWDQGWLMNDQLYDEYHGEGYDQWYDAENGVMCYDIHGTEDGAPNTEAQKGKKKRANEAVQNSIKKLKEEHPQTQPQTLANTNTQQVKSIAKRKKQARINAENDAAAATEPKLSKQARGYISLCG